MRPTSVLIERLGEAHVATLSAIAGGQRLSIPFQMADASHLTRRVGHDLAVALVVHFGGLRIYVPNGVHRGRRIDRDKLATLIARKLPASTIARQLGCSERLIRRHLSRIAKAKENRP